MREYCEDYAYEPAGVCRHCFEQLESENKRLREFKEFVNMMVRRSLNHTCSDYEALMSIDEKLIKE